MIFDIIQVSNERSYTYESANIFRYRILQPQEKTKREEFLDAMEEIIPWSYWVEMIRPYYFANKRGLKPIGIEIMLRMYLMQIWFNLSDEGIEDSIYDSYAMRSFMHIDFHEQQVPDASTLLKFRHMLESNKLGEKIFADVNSRLDKAGLMMHGGTIVDASLIAAPKSTKNQEGKRDPEMHQTKKGNEWYFGMKVHAGVDAGSGYVHTITGTSANMHDVTETANLIREDDQLVFSCEIYNLLQYFLRIKSTGRIVWIDDNNGLCAVIDFFVWRSVSFGLVCMFLPCVRSVKGACCQ